LVDPMNKLPNYDVSIGAATLTVSPANQTITITTPAPGNGVNGSNFTVAATASSGLPVSYSASGACTSIGSDFTITSNTGVCTVIFDQAGDANYNPAPQLSQEVTVISPQGGIALLINHVQNLIATGVISNGNGNALLSKLNGAVQSLDSGNTTAAINKLNSFINQVNALINSGKLTPAQGQVLIDATQAIINSIE